jgi:hypothetical protein
MWTGFFYFSFWIPVCLTSGLNITRLLSGFTISAVHQQLPHTHVHTHAPYCYTCSVWMSDRTSVIMSAVFHQLLMSLQGYAMTVTWSGQNHFLPRLFWFIMHQPSYHSILHSVRYQQYCEIHNEKTDTTMPFNKQSGLVFLSGSLHSPRWAPSKPYETDSDVLLQSSINTLCCCHMHWSLQHIL